MIRTLPSSKFRAVITSPPYFGHRRYGDDPSEIGREEDAENYLDSLCAVFSDCKNVLTDDGSLWIVIGDTRRQGEKLRVPHRLADRLVRLGFLFREDIIWYKKNNVSTSARDNFSQAYEYVLFFSKRSKSFADLDAIRVRGNEAVEGRNRVPPSNRLQFSPEKVDKSGIARIADRIHGATSRTPISELPTTAEISIAYGYDPEKYCPTCYRKFKRHATRRRIGNHKHYPIFAVCNPKGKNPSNVWEVATRAHYGNEHFAIFPEGLVERIIRFATQKGDFVLDPFTGRGTTGIVATSLGRKFVGIDLYRDNVNMAGRNIGLSDPNLLIGLARSKKHWR